MHTILDTASNVYKEQADEELEQNRLTDCDIVNESQGEKVFLGLDCLLPCWE